MSKVWDIPNDEIGPNEKYVLLAYADHADHEGKSIFPAVETIIKKTGYSERSVQYITRSLEESGYLIPDGQGRKGTNKWYIPLDEGGAKIAPVQKLRGAIHANESGANIAPLLGAKIAPELKLNRQLIDILVKRLNLPYLKQKDFTCWIHDAQQENGTLKIILYPTTQMDEEWRDKDFTAKEYFEGRYKKGLENILDPGCTLIIEELENDTLPLP